MNIQILILTILVAINYASCHPPPHHALEPQLESIRKNQSVTGSKCVAVAHRDPQSILRTRMKRSRIGKISLSPQSPPPPLPPYIGPDNSTETNSTLPTQRPSPQMSSWIPTLEDIVTPIFRTLILVLTLFNVNITWRIHGQWPALPLCSLDLIQS